MLVCEVHRTEPALFEMGLMIQFNYRRGKSWSRRDFNAVVVARVVMR